MTNLVRLLAIFLCMNTWASQDNFLPGNIMMLDPLFSHHVLLVEKSTHRLFLYENHEGMPRLLKTYKIATGQIMGDKAVQGDKKTPEGIYVFQNFHSGEELIGRYGQMAVIYGAGAFTTNYPNPMDRRHGKTGGGIWLHSTDDDSRIDKGLDSKGCVVATDFDLKDVSQYIDLKHTPVVIVQDVNFLSKRTWNEKKSSLLTTLNLWKESWIKKDFENYINQYSKREFFSSVRGNYSAYRTYKKAVFSRADSPKISFENTSILVFEDYAVVTMKQNYQSPVISDVGKKTLYLKRENDYKWKIITELWSKHESPQEQNLAFTPSMRYFEKRNNIEKN